MISAAVIAIALSLTNSITFTTNGVGSASTNKDEIYGTSSYLSLTLNTSVKNSNGVPVSIVTNSGLFTMFAPDGWGVQQQITMPPPQIVFSGFVTGSLAFNLITNLQAKTNGLNPASEWMFSAVDTLHTNWTRNAGFWLAFAPQITATVIASGTDQNMQIGGSAVTPRHVLNCSHAPYGAGQPLYFVDDTGTVIRRTVIDSVQVSGDTHAALLDSNLPPSVHPFSVLPPSYTNQLATKRMAIQGVGMNQTKQMFPKLIGISDVGLGAISASQWLGTDWNVDIHGGDSGHPIMLLIGTNLVLVAHWHTGNGGDNYAFIEPQINAALHYLSTNNGAASDYQLSTVNLSGYTSF